MPEYTHFSVKQSCTIGGFSYRPVICYAIPSELANTIENMEKKGMAKRYTEEMRFISGAPRPVRK